MKFYSARIENNISSSNGDELYYKLVASLSESGRTFSQRVKEAALNLNRYLNNPVLPSEVLGLGVGHATFNSTALPSRVKNNAIGLCDIQQVCTYDVSVAMISSSQLPFPKSECKGFTLDLSSITLDVLNSAVVIKLLELTIPEVNSIKQKVSEILNDILAKTRTFSIYRVHSGCIDVLIHSRFGQNTNFNRISTLALDAIVKNLAQGTAYVCRSKYGPHGVNAIDAVVKNHPLNFYCPQHPNLFLKQLVAADLRYSPLKLEDRKSVV